MYKLIKKILPSNHRLRPRGNYVITSITVHSVGNSTSTIYGERNWLDNPSNTRYAAWNDVVGEGEIINAIPHGEECWHCGSTYGNKHSIGVELIESGDRKKVLETGAEFVANLLKQYKLTIDDVKRHYDWTGKNCPRILIDPKYIKGGMDWKYFLKRVQFYLDGDEVIEKIRVIIDGKEVEVDRILKNGNNYIKIRDVADLMGYNISNKGSIPILNKKV